MLPNITNQLKNILTFNNKVKFSPIPTTEKRKTKFLVF